MYEKKKREIEWRGLEVSFAKNGGRSGEEEGKEVSPN